MVNISHILDHEEIVWPSICEPIEPVKGISSIGSCWKVLYIREHLMESLNAELKEKRRYAAHIDRRISSIGKLLSETSEDCETESYELNGEIAQLDVLLSVTNKKIAEIEKELEILNADYDDKYGLDTFSDHKNGKKTMCYAKMLLNPFVVRNYSCINDKHRGVNVRDQIEMLFSEVKCVKSALGDYLDAVIDEDSKENHVGALRILSTEIVQRKSASFKDTFSVIYFCPAMEKGSIADFLTGLPNGLQRYKLDDTLIFENLKDHIHLLSFMERRGIGHNMIKPNNVLISQSGMLLLLTDFCPRSIFIERCYKISQNELKMPLFISPELWIILSNGIALNSPSRSRELAKRLSKQIGALDFPDKIEYIMYKHDVFCLGLIYYSLLALQTFVGIEHTVYENIMKDLVELKETHKPEIVDLVMSMLEFDPSDRKSWSQLQEELSGFPEYN